MTRVIYGWERASIEYAWFDDARALPEELPLGDYLDEPVTA